MLIKINYENKISAIGAKYFRVKLYTDKSAQLQILSQQYSYDEAMGYLGQ
jgi:hypothetical protein